METPHVQYCVFHGNLGTYKMTTHGEKKVLFFFSEGTLRSNPLKKTDREPCMPWSRPQNVGLVTGKGQLFWTGVSVLGEWIGPPAPSVVDPGLHPLLLEQGSLSLGVRSHVHMPAGAFLGRMHQLTARLWQSSFDLRIHAVGDTCDDAFLHRTMHQLTTS